MTARHFGALFRSQFRDELRAGEVLMVVLPFAVVGLLAIPMAIGIDTPLLDRIGTGMFWIIVMLFGVIVTQRHSAAVPEATRDVIRLAGVDPALRFAAPAAVSFLLLLIFEVGAGAVALILYGSTVPDGWWLAAILPLAAAGLAMIGTIAGALTSGVGVRSSLAPLLVVPISVPLLLGAAQATEGLRQGAGILRWLLLLAAVDLVLAIAGVLTARPLEEAAS